MKKKVELYKCIKKLTHEDQKYRTNSIFKNFITIRILKKQNFI